MASLALVPPLTHEARASWGQFASERLRAGRAALRLLTTESKSRCVAVAGLSLGGLVAVAVGNLEPDVDIVVAMLAGSGPELVRSLALLNARGALGQVGAPNSGAFLGSPRLSRDRVLMVRALFDELVPAGATAHLAEALGHPAVHVYPSGHASFRVLLPLAVWRALGFIERACIEAR
jgi:pimeloyl-ACP methyl ester carboxylesterase